MTVHYTREGPVGVADHRPARGPQRASTRRSATGCGTACAGSTPTTRAVLVLTGAGDRAFCAGGDLKEMADAALEVPPPDFLPAVRPQHRRAQADDRGRQRRGLRGRFPAGADVRPGAWPPSTPRSRSPRCRVGRGAPWAAPLPWLVPPRVAAARSCSPASRSAPRGAYEIGLVNRVVPGRRAARAATQALAERIAANAPLSVRGGQGARSYLSAAPPARGFDGPRRSGSRSTAATDAQEGPRAFRREARPPCGRDADVPVSMRRRSPTTSPRETGGAARAARRRSTRRAGGAHARAAGWSVRDQVDPPRATSTRRARCRRPTAGRFRGAARSRPTPRRPDAGGRRRTATGRGAERAGLVRRRPVAGCSRCSARSTRRCGCPGTGRR